MIFCRCSKRIKNLERQINQFLPLLVQKAELDKQLEVIRDGVRVSVNKALVQMSNEAARALVQNVRSGNESINFIHEIVMRIKALQLDLRPAEWELRGQGKVAEVPKAQPPATVVK